MRTVDDLMNELPPKRRQAVAKMTDELIAEELTLRALRQAHKRTQEDVAKILGIKQNAVSKLEQRSDLLLSTLSNYVNALGGRLHLVAEFPNRPPVALKGLGDLAAKD
ncbi:MAG: helix-turn-helix transcriptional regulator [Rhodospirillaceae bacterium]|jgi:DNA-binding XRE family transcriptional regulator|nr:helix-turn-helix transcriptional regulator [Rhodospirillaceae bacterium]MBT4046489.1 helix-turn-helix transcriptional regulator [Rhodospirillaceae bacterium]MBT4687699.1 helix-turn-helix transcriptional regulator [Rhodospirillaceae bacterium]MBT5082877.1 helix-turn-helix transcriptional regulator [Rhodospirillaceae bacterium]MBT5524321.1 helix-turn-helix transcriptional regulator [Rhodospirillaceae bacterium]